MVTAGHTASDVAGDQHGVGLLIAEGELPVRLRSYYLADEDLDTLAGRARWLRGPDDEPRCAHCGTAVTDITTRHKGVA